MGPFLPVKLKGDNLGTRHLQFNHLVNDAYSQGVAFPSIRDLPEESALDHLFKIDLASKFKNTDYIISNLKHDDILYVCRALKGSWLLDDKYSSIINPMYLEDNLYPEMTSVAVTKMKNWLHVNLKDEQRCEQFYQYYNNRKEGDASMKFLWKCSEEFILNEASKPEILQRLEPHHLKLLIEKCPQMATVFFDNISTDEQLKKKYLSKQSKYYETLKCLLKTNTDIFLDITEKYYNANKFKQFNTKVTEYIIKSYKERFNKKPELYTSRFLDVNALAKCLSEEEIKELILKLARAKYLEYWFGYKAVASLIKRLCEEERPAFKKKVFVDKNVGDIVEKWPYDTPSSPVLKIPAVNIFEDKKHDPEYYRRLALYDLDFSDIYDDEMDFRCMLKKRKYCCYRSNNMLIRKTSLDELFDKYRFINFEKTMMELQKQLPLETLKHRQNIMLVLISKSGGRVESLQKLLEFLSIRHKNEPLHFRATVIRSLVKRCNAWRLPQNLWEQILEYGRDAGLDGSPSTVACVEGIHAVVIRDILLDQQINSAVWKAFMGNFSTMKHYSLNQVEKEKIANKLAELLIADCKKETNYDAVDRLNKALDTLEAYKIRIDTFPNLITAIAETSHNNDKVESLLHRLFKSRIARKELFKENFKIFQGDASYLNALKHDSSIISDGTTFKALIESNKLKHDGFIKSLSLYFGEENGLASKYFKLLMEYVKVEEWRQPVDERKNKENPKNKLARYIAILSGDKLKDLIKEFSYVPKKTYIKRFAAELRANSHLARPPISLNALDWKLMGAKAIANRVLKCRNKDIDGLIQALMTWNRTQRLALILSMKVGKEATILSAIAERRPRFAIKAILPHLKGQNIDKKAWDVIITTLHSSKERLIHKIKPNKTEKKDARMCVKLSKADLVPSHLKAKYCVAVYPILHASGYIALPILCHIENVFPEVEQAFIQDILSEFLNNEFTYEKICKNSKNEGKLSTNCEASLCLHFRMIGKYLLLGKNENEVDEKWEKLGSQFFDRLEQLWKTTDEKLMVCVDDFIKSLNCSSLFFNPEYDGCLPALKLITKRLQSILPLHEYYDKYVTLHLTMLYLRAVRQSVKNNPVIFEDLPKHLNDGTEIVGRIFGKLIANELVDLIEKYFESIRDIYKVALKNYLSTYFETGYLYTIFIINIVRGILGHENIITYSLAEYIFEQDSYSWPEHQKNEIYDTLKESKSMEVRFFLNAHDHPW